MWGTTANPYDPSRTAGGSSGGGAAALAARMVPVADGSDNMGSLRNPPAFNHVVGLRPSWGRVPEPGFIPYGSVNGPMGRTTADVAQLLSTMAGPDAGAPLCIDEDPASLSADLDRDCPAARIAWVGDWDGYLPTEPGVLELCESALATFERLGCEVEPVLPAYAPQDIWQSYLAWRSWGNLRYADLYEDPATRALMKPELVWEIEYGLRLTALDLTRAAAARDAWYAALAGMFERYDFVVAPSAQVFPFDKSVHWPRDDRRSPHGHLPPVDGDRRPVDDGRAPGGGGARPASTGEGCRPGSSSSAGAMTTTASSSSPTRTRRRAPSWTAPCRRC